MSTRSKCLILLLSIASARAGDKEKTEKAKDVPKFHIQPASSYANKQTSAGLTIAVVPYLTDEQNRSAFGKVNLNDHGVLPVMVVMQNDSKQTLNLQSMRFEYVGIDQKHVEATPSRDVPYLEGASRPKYGPGIPSPIPLPPRSGKKSKLNIPEIEGLAMAVKMLPAGDSAHGFVYFQVRHWKGSRVYINGIREAATGKELFYFEVPLD